MLIVNNYHVYSKEQEAKQQKELLYLIGILIGRLNNIINLTNTEIDNIITLWEIEYGKELSELNKYNLEQLNNYVFNIIKHKYSNERLINKLYDANQGMLSITINHIRNKFKELAILENDYDYTQKQSDEFLKSIIHSIDNSIDTFIVQSNINNIRMLLFAGASQAGYTEYRWRTCRDNRVRPSHAYMDDRWVKINEAPRETGYMHVGQDYNCRCWIVEFR